jgi:phosphatidate cytidylyltransferase
LLKRRIISGCLIGAALVLSAHYMPAFGILLLLVGVSSFAQLEFYAMLRAAGVPVFRIVGTVCGAALIAATFFTMVGEYGDVAAAYKWEHFVLVASLIAVFVRQFPQKHNDNPLETIACTLLGIWYVPYLFNFFTRLVFACDGGAQGLAVSKTGRLLALYLVVVVKCGDIGAYFMGTLLGRHKLFPRVSPGKTWEGLGGGIACAVIASVGFSLADGGRLGAATLHVGHAVVLGCLLAGVGVVGDMFESLLKRAVGAKDSSSAIPGMGGLLDVMDSLLFGAPALYVYTKAFLL